MGEPQRSEGPEGKVENTKGVADDEVPVVVLGDMERLELYRLTGE